MQIESLMTYFTGEGWSTGPGIIDPSDLVAIIVIPSLVLMVGWLVWMLTRTNHLKTKARIELQKRLLEKLNSAQEVVQLMQTEEGRQLLEALTIERTTPLEQILHSVQKGVVLTIVGLGGLSLRLFFPTGFGVFIVIGVFLGALGMGFLVSAGVAYAFSRSWDLLRSAQSDSEPRKSSLFG
jgi:hypothetical protein